MAVRYEPLCLMAATRLVVETGLGVSGQIAMSSAFGLTCDMYYVSASWRVFHILARKLPYELCKMRTLASRTREML